MRRHQPAGLCAIRDDRRLDLERGAQLLLELVPQRAEAALLDDVGEVDAGRGENAVIGVELAVSEPEAVVGAGVEPAAVIVLGPFAQDRRGGADILGDAIDELEQVVGAGVEHRIAASRAGG